MDRKETIVVLPNDRRAVADYRACRLRRGGGVSVQVTSLPSGLAVVTDATPHLKTAAIGVFVAAGSRHERAGEHGLSHLHRAHGVQGHATAKRARHRRGDRERRRRSQRRDRRRTDQLFRPRSGERRRARARRHRRHSHRQRVRLRTNSNARRTSSSRKSARSRIRRTTWCSISSPRPPGRTSRSAGRSSARGRASALSTGPRSTAISAGATAPASTVVAAAGAVEHDHIVDLVAVPARTACRARRRRPKRRPLSRRRDQAQARASSRRMSWSASRAGRPARRITTPPRFSPPRSAAACRRGSSRRCARSAASPIRSIGFHWDFIRYRAVRLLRRLGRPGCGGGGRRLARLPCAKPRTGSSEAEIRRAKAQMKVSLRHRARAACGARSPARRARCRSTGARFRSTKCWPRVDAIYRRRRSQSRRRHA